jgi:hypothetical protein
MSDITINTRTAQPVIVPNTQPVVVRTTQPVTVTDWGNEIYNGLNGVGLFKADLIMIIVLILAAVMIVVGIYMIGTNDSDKYLRVQGTVVQPNCVKAPPSYDAGGRGVENYKCNVVVTYKINGKVYGKNIYLVHPTSYSKGESIELMVLKTNHNDAMIATTDKATVGCIMVGVSIAAVALAYLNYYLTHNYRVFSVAQGTLTLVSLFQ